MSATLTGTISFSGSPVPNLILEFWPLTYPVTDGAVVESGGKAEATTDEDGVFEVELASAVYRVEWWLRGVRNRGMFAITEDSDLANILVGDVAETVPYYFADVPEFEASRTGATMVGVGLDGNGDPAIFRKDTGSTLDDGVNGIVRDDGVGYVRFSGNPLA